jgi:SpoVK/Ycf46/Vps4 family AAA+-type ATPase
MAIMGPSGIGKTAISKVISFVFSKIGILAKGKIKIISPRGDLIAQYVGQTAYRTKAILMDSLESILFIDEVYELARSSSPSDYGPEAITEIVNFLDKYIGLNIVIVAGYEDKTKSGFFDSNEGLIRRFPHQYVLSPYSETELTCILLADLKQRLPPNIQIDSKTEDIIYSLVLKLKEDAAKIGIDVYSKQAGDMLNLSTSLNKAILGAYTIKWTNEYTDRNIHILMSGFEEFFDSKRLRRPPKLV